MNQRKEYDSKLATRQVLIMLTGFSLILIPVLYVWSGILTKEQSNFVFVIVFCSAMMNFINYFENKE